MTVQKRLVTLIVAMVGIVLAGILFWQFVLPSDPPAETSAYNETFDSVGSWVAGEDANAQGNVTNGVYEMFVELSGDIFWVTAGRNFADGIYQVEATPLEGTIDNGYGMLFRINDENDSFYVFKVSSDGYIFIGRCSNRCADVQTLVERDWFASEAVKQGMDSTNELQIVAKGSEMTFYVNETEVGRVSDDSLSQGDIGLIAETLSPGGLRVAFDNFKVTPLESQAVER